MVEQTSLEPLSAAGMSLALRWEAAQLLSVAVLERAHDEMSSTTSLSLDASLHVPQFLCRASEWLAGGLGLTCFVSCFTQGTVILLLFRLPKISLCCLVLVPRVEARGAELGTQTPGSEVGEAK